MTPPLITQAHVEDILRRLRKLETRVGRTQVRERSNYDFITRVPTYTGGTTAGVTTYAFQGAAYRVNGNQITDIGQINWSASTGTGEARFSLGVAPVTYNASGIAWLSGVTFANNTPIIQANAGNLYFVLDSPLTNAGNTRVQMEAVGSVIWVVTYFI